MALLAPHGPLAARYRDRGRGPGRRPDRELGLTLGQPGVATYGSGWSVGTELGETARVGCKIRTHRDTIRRPPPVLAVRWILRW